MYTLVVSILLSIASTVPSIIDSISVPSLFISLFVLGIDLDMFEASINPDEYLQNLPAICLRLSTIYFCRCVFSTEKRRDSANPSGLATVAVTTDPSHPARVNVTWQWL